jgi:hypothetical protein
VAIYRVPIEITWPGPGSPGANVWHVRVDGVDAGLLQTAVGALNTFYSAIINEYANGTTVSLGEVVDVQERTYASPSWTAIPPSAAAGAAPPHLAVVVSWRTSLARRRGMGRTFLGPLAFGGIEDDGTPNDLGLSLIRTAAQDLLDASTGGGGWAVGVWGLDTSVPEGLEDTETQPHVLRDYIDFRVRDQFAVLRSRRD